MTRRNVYAAGLLVAVLALAASVVFAVTSMNGTWRTTRVASTAVVPTPGTSAPTSDDAGSGGWMMSDGMMGGPADRWSSAHDGWGAGMWSGMHLSGPSYGWDGRGPVTSEAAAAQAKAWVARYVPGAALDAGARMPMGFRFTATRSGALVAVVMVDETSGDVWGRLAAANP